MRRSLILLSGVLLACAVSSCNDKPAPRTASHPPASELRSKAEPVGLTEEQIRADTDGVDEAIYWTNVLMWGRELFDKAQRTCQWHKERGSEVPCDPLPPYTWPN